MHEKRKRELCRYLVGRFTSERVAHKVAPDSTVDALVSAVRHSEASTESLWLAVRALMNVREPWEADNDLLCAQDELLRGLIDEAGIVRFEDAEVARIDARLRLWQGDITTLRADAIVNAANSRLTGCWAPLHYCIDNAIHTFAGIELRLECARLMRAQGYLEPTGCAKVTGAYNLPSRFVVHTVGPIANGRPTDAHRRELERCYVSCLDAAAASGLRQIAFCCISTGVFGFPQPEAARIAVSSVRAWLDACPDACMQVLFNVFLDSDARLYRELLCL